MAVYNFGPATITHNGVNLGSTISGGSITVEELSYRSLRTQALTKVPIGGSGIIRLFQLSSGFTLSSSLLFATYASLAIVQTGITLTIPYCSLYYPTNYSFGQWEFQAMDLSFDFIAHPSTGSVIVVS